MADIELVIKVSEDSYKATCNGWMLPQDVENMVQGIKNGTPLPKGHGDLVTKEQMIELVEFYQLNPQHFDFVNLIDEIKDEKPIIEADKEHEDDNT